MVDMILPLNFVVVLIGPLFPGFKLLRAGKVIAGQADMYVGNALADNGLRVLLVQRVVAPAVKHFRSSFDFRCCAGKQRKSGGGRQEYRFPPKSKNFSLFSQSFAPWAKRLWNLPPYPDGVSQYSLAFAGEYWETLSREKRAADSRLAICGLKKVMYVRLGLQRPGGGAKGSECHPHPLFLS